MEQSQVQPARPVSSHRWIASKLQVQAQDGQQNGPSTAPRDSGHGTLGLWGCCGAVKQRQGLRSRACCAWIGMPRPAGPSPARRLDHSAWALLLPAGVSGGVTTVLCPVGGPVLCTSGVPPEHCCARTTDGCACPCVHVQSGMVGGMQPGLGRRGSDLKCRHRDGRTGTAAGLASILQIVT